MKYLNQQMETDHVRAQVFWISQHAWKLTCWGSLGRTGGRGNRNGSCAPSPEHQCIAAAWTHGSCQSCRVDCRRWGARTPQSEVYRPAVYWSALTESSAREQRRLRSAACPDDPYLSVYECCAVSSDIKNEGLFFSLSFFDVLTCFIRLYWLEWNHAVFQKTWSDFLGCVLPLEQTTAQRLLCSFSGCVSVRQLFFKLWIHWCRIQGHVDAHTHTHETSIPDARKHLHLRLHHSSNWRQLSLCIPPLTILTISSLSYERHLQISHTQMSAQGTQWLLFIVHSFMWRASCLAWYGIILRPTLSFSARPWGTRRPQTHNCDCATHWIHSDQRCCFSGRYFSHLASLSCSNWILNLALYSLRITELFLESFSGCISSQVWMIDHFWESRQMCRFVKCS